MITEKKGKTEKMSKSSLEYLIIIYTHRFQIKSFVEGTISLIKQFSQAVMNLRISFKKPIVNGKTEDSSNHTNKDVNEQLHIDGK